MLNGYFKLAENGTTVRTEVLAGLTTFLTMAYIIFVNPQILADAGMNPGAVFVATCVAAAIGTAVMGLYANYPIAQAPGMGLNAYFTYAVVLGLNYTWQQALAAVFISGLLFIALSLSGLREYVINAIPRTLKIGISAGIGLFLAIIALKNAGIVVANEATTVALGDLRQAGPVLCLLGFAVIVALTYRRVPGAVIVGVLLATLAGLPFGAAVYPGQLVSLPPSIAPTLFALDLVGILNAGIVAIILTFFLVDLFDTAGTLVGVAQRAKLLDAEGRLPRMQKALLADAAATTIGALLGTSTVTSYIESAAGTNVGGRTGLTAVVVAVLFLLALFLAPLAGMVPAYATASALLFVACLMAAGLAEIDWDDPTEYAPAVVTALGMPLTYSIANGIGLGFVTFAVIKLLSGRFADVGPAVIGIALVFVLKFGFNLGG